jgi:hypothetical protein
MSQEPAKIIAQAGSSCPEILHYFNLWQSHFFIFVMQEMTLFAVAMRLPTMTE